MSQDPLAGLPLSNTVREALTLASNRARGGPLQTGALLDALVHVDQLGDWSRLWLYTGSPDQLSLADVRDAPSDAAATWHGVPLSSATARSLGLLAVLSRAYELNPAPPGALALTLLAIPDGGASTTLMNAGHLTAAELRGIVQSDLLNIDLTGLEEFLREQAPDVTPPPPAETRFGAARFRFDTAARVALVMVTITLAGLFFLYLEGISGSADAEKACTVTAWRVVPTVQKPDQFVKWAHVWNSCRAPALRGTGILMLSGVSALFLAYGVTTAQVTWRVRRRGLRPLDDPLEPELSRVIGEYSRAAGLPKPPQLYRDVAGQAPAAFGKTSAPILALNQGTLIDFTGNRPRFDALVHHELFHFRGNDVRTYYRSLAALRAILFEGALFLTILFVVLLVGHRITDAVILLTQSVAIALLGYATLRDYIRRRELVADMWAVDQTGTTAGIADALRRFPPKARRLRFFHTHPTAQERLRALTDRRRALEFKAGAAFLAGTAAGLLSPTLAQYLPTTGITWIIDNAVALAGVIGGAPLAYVLAIGIWRNTHLDMLAEKRRRTGLVAGLCAGTGLLVGGVLSLQLVFVDRTPVIPISLLTVSTVIAGSTMLTLWIGLSARIRLRLGFSALDGQAYRWGLRFAAVVGGALGAVIYQIASLVQGNRVASGGALGNMPRPSRSAEGRLIRTYVETLAHGWVSYAVLMIAVGYLIGAWFVSGTPSPKAKSTEQARATPNPSVNPPLPGPLIPNPRSSAGRSSPPLLQQSGESFTAQPDGPPLSASPLATRRPWFTAILLLTSVAGLAGAEGLNPDLLYLVSACAGALFIAWWSRNNHSLSVWLVVAVYAVTITATSAATLPWHHYRTLIIVTALIAGTLGYMATGMPKPGNAHTWVLLTVGLVAHHSFWLLLSIFVVGPLVGGLINRVDPGPNPNSAEGSMSLGFAIASVVVIALEALMA